MRVFFRALPYLWPRGETRLHMLLCSSLFFMIMSSACELYAPIPMRGIIAALKLSTDRSPVNDSIHFPISSLTLFALALIGGVIGSRLRDTSFAAISAETERSIVLDSFRHLQQLSLRFHQQRETGAILRSLSRGAGTYSALIKSSMFILMPMLIKVVVTCMIFAILFQWYYVTIIIIFLVCYIIFSVASNVWRDKYRRVMNDKDNEKNHRVLGRTSGIVQVLLTIFLLSV